MSEHLFRKALGSVMRDLRFENGMNLRQVSSKACVALGYLSELENGHKEASSEVVEMIANALGLPTYELILLVGSRMGGLDKAPDTAEKLFADEYADLVAVN